MNHVQPYKVALSSIALAFLALVVGKIAMAEKILIYGAPNLLIPHPITFVFQVGAILLSLVFIYQGYSSNWSFLYETDNGSVPLWVRSTLAAIYVLVVSLMLVDMYWHLTNVPTQEAVTFIQGWGSISAVVVLPAIITGVVYWLWNA